MLIQLFNKLICNKYICINKNITLNSNIEKKIKPLLRTSLLCINKIPT